MTKTASVPYSDAKQRRSKRYMELHSQLKREVTPAIEALESLDKRTRKMLRSAEFRAGRG